MDRKSSIIFKLLLTGCITTVVRIIGQMLIPAGEQSVLAPSVFAQNGTMPLAFTIYGIFAYTGIAALFLLIRGRIGGPRLLQGVKYALVCSAVWIAYLMEPLPHTAPIDRITYPIADSLALIVMGLMLGWLLGKEGVPAHSKRRTGWLLPVLTITVLFVSLRLVQYVVFDIYSSFSGNPLENIIWSLSAGLVSALSVLYLSAFVYGSRLRRALVLGLLLFGVDLALFNFFMPLVFSADVPDLILRTTVDTIAVTLGCLSLPALSLPQDIKQIKSNAASGSRR